jgi:peptide chain release factor subunit 1
MEELVAGRGLVAYGEAEIRSALKQGAVELLLISEGLVKKRVTVRCQACGHEIEETVEDLEQHEKRLPERACPNCDEKKLSLAESKDVVQDLLDLAERFNTKVEFISTETDEGKQFLIAFKGLAAILRFRAG